MFRFHFDRELAALWQQPWRRASLVLFALLCGWALLGGLSWQRATERVLATMPADQLTDREAWFADLDKAEAGEAVSPYAARPMNLTMLALQQPERLAALSYREESINPHSALISGWRSEASLFRRYEVQGPSALWAGRLDLSFVVVVLLPLFLTMLSFDVLGREREAGRLSLFLVQGGSASQLVFARVLATALPLAAIPAFAVIVAALINGASAGATGLWLGTIVVYTVLWVAIASWIAARFRKTTSGAMAVLAAWSLLIVLLPSGSQFVAQALHPVPSRVSYLSEARDAEAQARRNVSQRAEIYMAEHPGQGDTPDDAVPGFYRSAFLANVDINARTAPIVGNLEAQQEAQRNLVSLIGYLSPAIIAQEVLHSASGTGAARSAEFRRQTRAYLRGLLAQIGPATVNRNRLTSAQARAVPAFEFAPSANTGHAILRLSWVLMFAWAMIAAALRQTRRVA